MTCCNKNCNQGRNCPARQACELPIDVAEPDNWLDDLLHTGGWVLLWLIFLFIVFFTAGYFAG